MSGFDISDQSAWERSIRRPLSKAAHFAWNKWLYPHVVAPFKESHEPPWFDARGVAIGFLIGFAVPVGGQLVLITFLRVFFRFNSLLAFGFSLVSNPFNCLPLYYGYYLLGSCIVGESPRVSRESFDTMMQAVTDSGHFWESLTAFFQLGGDILLRWSVAAIVLGVSSSVIGYVVTYALKKRVGNRKPSNLVGRPDNQPLKGDNPS